MPNLDCWQVNVGKAAGGSFSLPTTVGRHLLAVWKGVYSTSLSISYPFIEYQKGPVRAQ